MEADGQTYILDARKDQDPQRTQEDVERYLSELRREEAEMLKRLYEINKIEGAR